MHPAVLKFAVLVSKLTLQTVNPVQLELISKNRMFTSVIFCEGTSSSLNISFLDIFLLLPLWLVRTNKNSAYVWLVQL